MSDEVKVVSSGGTGFAGLLTLLFIFLKLTGQITWSWIWVVSPLWISILLGIAIVIIVLIILGIGMLIAYLIDKWS